MSKRIWRGVGALGAAVLGLVMMASVAGAAGEKSSVVVTNTGSPQSPPVTFFVNGMSDRPVGLDKIELVNDSIGDHVLIVYKIPNGWTKAQFLAALNSPAPPPEGAFEVGAVFAKPGNRAQKKFDFAATGTYGFFCPIPNPAGNPHFNLGFVGTFEVTPA